MFNEVKGVVDAVMAGFNGTIMAYGQTSAGKSFSMEGLSLRDPGTQGVIPRCVDKLFDEIEEADEDNQFQVILSFYEIYCEKVRDLLNPQQTNLKLRESKNAGFIVQDVTEIYCTDRESVLRVIEFGKANRAAAPTLMNAESSRSHSIVSIMVDQKNTSTGRNKKGNLFLVDLAGSEKVSKTGASGMRLEEAKNINGSLTTLGMVINALCDNQGHVPYRDSKLTMILMDALGGNSKTTLIICCNPEHKHTPETLSTLRFGERAKRIKNHARVNEEYSVDELKQMLVAAKKEIVQLKSRLQGQDGQDSSNRQSPQLIGADASPGGNAMTGEDMALFTNWTREREDLLTEKEQMLNELTSLKARIGTLEEELETERMKLKDEQEQHLELATESQALKATITELEEKLLKVLYFCLSVYISILFNFYLLVDCSQVWIPKNPLIKI
jgi:kinesin family protein 5